MDENWDTNPVVDENGFPNDQSAANNLPPFLAPPQQASVTEDQFPNTQPITVPPSSDWDTNPVVPEPHVQQPSPLQAVPYLQSIFAGMPEVHDQAAYQADVQRRQKEYDDQLAREEMNVRMQDERSKLHYKQLEPLDSALLGISAGVEDVKRQYGGLMEAFPMVFNPVNPEFARKTGKEFAGESGKEATTLQEAAQQPNEPLVNTFVNKVSEMIPNFLPMVLGGGAAKVAGLSADAVALSGPIVMGAQKFADTFQSAKDAYVQQGMSENDAGLAAYNPALISGALTTLTWKYIGGDTGAAALEKGLSVDTIKPFVESVLEGAGRIGGASGVDTLSGDIVAKASYDPNKPIGDIISDSVTSFLSGAALGGISEGAISATRAILRRGGSAEAQLARDPQEQPPVEQAPEQTSAVEQPTVPVQPSSIPVTESAQPALTEPPIVPRGTEPVLVPQVVAKPGSGPLTIQDFLKSAKVARTPEELSTIIGASSLPEPTKAVFQAALKTPLLQDLEWPNVFAAYGEGRGELGGFRYGNILALTSDADPTTLIHEAVHMIEAGMPDAYRAKIESWRQAELKARFGDQVPEGLQDGSMTSDQFRSSGLPVSDYHLINPHEYIADLIGNRFVRSLPPAEGASPVLGKVMQWVVGTWNTFSRALKLPVSKGRLFREVIEGRYKSTPEVNPEFQAHFVENADQARNVGKLVEGKPDEEKVQGRDMLAQTTDILGLLAKHGSNLASRGAQGLLRLGEYLGINEEGLRLNGAPEDYRTAKANTPDEHQRTWLARSAATQITKLVAGLEDVKRQFDEKVAERLSPGFQRKVSKDSVLKQGKDYAEAINKATDSILLSAHKKAQQALNDERLSDVDAARIEGELRQIDEASKSSSAMHKLMEDMVNTVSSTPEGQRLLSDPSFGSQTQLLKVYNDLKTSTGQSAYSPALQRWASYILRKNPELADELQAAQLSRDSAVRKAMGPYEAKLLSDLENNPTKTLERELRLKGKRQTVEDKARFAYLTLHSDLLKSEKEFATLSEANDVANGMLNDPDFKALRNEMYKDFEVEGTKQQSFTPLSDKAVLMPWGDVLDVDLGKVKGRVTTQQWNDWIAGRDKLRDWLKNNQDDPNYALHERNLANIEIYLTQQSMLEPADRFKVWIRGINSLFQAIRNAGGPVASATIKAAQRLNFTKQRVAKWISEYRPSWVKWRESAMDSHDLKWDNNGGKESIATVSDRFYQEHLNEIIYSRNRQTGGLKVGDRTGSGMLVTQADLDEIRKQSEASSAGFKVVKENFGGEDNFIVDRSSGVVMQRRPTKGTEDYIFRRFSDGLKTFVRDFKSARDVGNEGEQIALLNKPGIWNRVIYPFMADRDSQFARATDLDGHNGALEQAADLWRQTSGKGIKDFDSLLDNLTSHSTLTRDEVKAEFLHEFGRQVESMHKQYGEFDSAIQSPVTGERSNSFTEGRTNAVANFGFYDYGFRDSGSFGRFASMIYSRGFERVVVGVDRLIENVDRRIEERNAATKVLSDQRIPNPEKKAINARNAARKAGDNFEHWINLDSTRKDLQQVKDMITKPVAIDKVDELWMRTFGSVTAGLVANIMTTARNVLDTGIFMGAVSYRLGSLPILRQPAALYYLLIDQTLKGLLSTGRSLEQATLEHGVPAIIDAMKEFTAKVNKGKRTRSAALAFYPLFYDTAVNTYARWKDVQELHDLGLDHIDRPDLEFQARMIAGLRNAGEIVPGELHGVRKLASTGISALEAVLLPIRTLLPALGEKATNAGARKFFMEGKFSHPWEMKSRLDRIAKANTRPFDFDDYSNPINDLTTKELFPGFLSKLKDDDDKEWIRIMYQDAGIDFRKSYMDYLKSKMVDNVPNPQYLSPDDRTLLTNYVLGLVNKSQFIHRPVVLSGRGAASEFIKPLFGWSLRTLNTLNDVLSVAATSDQSRARQYAMLAAMTLPPLLMASAYTDVRNRYIVHAMKRAIYNQQSSDRQPWEREGLKSQAIGWGIAATYAFPLLNRVLNAAFNDTPVRASLDPSFVMADKVKDLLNYIGGVVQTGNPLFHLPETIEGFYPDSRIILNRLPSEAGKRIGSDVVASMRRVGPVDVLKPSNAQSSAPNYTELSPYGPKMENAALQGDIAGLQQIFSEAVSKAMETRNLSQPDAEKLVKQLFRSRDPLGRVFSTKLSDAQLQTALGKLDPSERAEVQGAIDNFAAGANALGMNYTASNPLEKADRRSVGGSATLSRASSNSSSSGQPGQVSPLSRAGNPTYGTGPSIRTQGLRRLSGGSRGLGSLRGTRARTVSLGGGRRGGIGRSRLGRLSRRRVRV